MAEAIRKAMKKPRVIVLRTAGTNCDKETAFAFQASGAETELVHINELTSHKHIISGDLTKSSFFADSGFK